MRAIYNIIIICVLFFSCKKETSEKEKIVAGKNSLSCAPATTDAKWFETDSKAPLFDGLDVIHFPISTKNPEAQKYFNQGLALAYGFNHAEAARSFYYATKLDPKCAMCFWGYAYVLGPNYNAGMEPDNYERAYKAIQQAIKLSDKAEAARATETKDYTIVTWPESEKIKFRRIAQGEWEKMSTQSPNAKEAYDLITKFLKDNGMI